ncbi:MAG TPA: metal ABC transporter ATP-binding protein [Bacillota bacterium]|nr:metal ABC transporter ATP-binding protein [Bacillota bacterium]HPT87227.1 metal ABC transporter ATP-binding protein [Bacillota bacterium]
MSRKDQMSTSPILQLKGVSIGYSDLIALKDVSFEVYPGEFVGVVGPNGSGKSTLLKGILGLRPLLAGSIHVAGVPHHARAEFRSKIGYVPQKNKGETQFPVTALEVVLMGLYSRIGWFRRPKPEHWERAADSLKLVGMGDWMHRHFWDLSGGQQQRVIIARALVGKPELLILDEPTSAVDITAQHEILELLEKLNREAGMTIMVVSHDINEIVHFCDKVLLLDKTVCGFGTASEVLTKENLARVYGERIFVYDHNGHPHVLVGDFGV